MAVCACMSVPKTASPLVVSRLVYPWLQLRPVGSGTWSQLKQFEEVATQSVSDKKQFIEHLNEGVWVYDRYNSVCMWLHIQKFSCLQL